MIGAVLHMPGGRNGGSDPIATPRTKPFKSKVFCFFFSKKKR
jgi:hypothetical protein